MTYPNLNIDPELLKLKVKDDEIKELKYRLEKHDYENILKTRKIDSEYYKKKYRSSKRKYLRSFQQFRLARLD